MLCGHGMPRDFARAVISRCWRQEGTTRPRRRRGAERTEWTGWTGWTNGADRTDRTDWVRGWWGEICCGLGVAIRWCRVAQPPAGGRHPCGMRRREGWLCDGARRGIRTPDQLCVREMCGWGRMGRGGTPRLRWPAVGLVGEDLWGSGRGVFLGVLWPAARPRRCSQRPLRCLTRRLTAGSPFGQPRGWLSPSARLARSRLLCRWESVASQSQDWAHRIATFRVTSEPPVCML